MEIRVQSHASSQDIACCDVVNHGAAYAASCVFISTLDGQTIAVAADSGKELWRTRTFEHR